jgi:hypothetical protein
LRRSSRSRPEHLDLAEDLEGEAARRLHVVRGGRQIDVQSPQIADEGSHGFATVIDRLRAGHGRRLGLGQRGAQRRKGVRGRHGGLPEGSPEGSAEARLIQ